MVHQSTCAELFSFWCLKKKHCVRSSDNQHLMNADAKTLTIRFKANFSVRVCKRGKKVDC